MEQYNLFSVPVVKYENFISESQAEKIFNHLRDDDTAIKHDTIKGDAKTTSRVNDPQVLKNYPQVEQSIQTALDQYTQHVGILPTKILNSWFNIQHENSELVPHVHPLGAVSGALIINADENSSGLTFKNPNYEQMHFCWWLTINETEFNKKHEIFQVSIGDLFLFPSYIYHGGVLNFTKNRLVIAFDATFIDSPK
jgi:uncharacterized protein (TIGR02466 family)